MDIRKYISESYLMIKRHGNILENTIAMSLITILNSSFQLIIYPFLIRKVGAELYGQFAFALSVASYFMVFIAFGFDMIATKHMSIAQSENDHKKKSHIVSSVLSAKSYLFLAAIIIYIAIVCLVPRLYEYKELYFSLIVLLVGYVFIPGWYYQALQNNRVYLVIQIIFKVLLLLIVIFALHDDRAIFIYSWAFAITSALGYLVSAIYLIIKDKIKIKLLSFRETKIFFLEASPLFLSNFVSIFKTSGIYLLIGTFFGMKELTAFDFGFRITQNVLHFTKSLNLAIFPNIVANYSIERVKRIFRKEVLLGLVMTLSIIVIGKPLIIIMGNAPIMDIAYPVLVIMSGMVFIWFLSSFFVDLVLIPQNMNNMVFWNQLLSLFLIILFSVVSYLLQLPLWAFTLSILIAGCFELLFLYYLSRNKTN